MRQIKDNPPDLRLLYEQYRITSIELAKQTGFTPSAIRRALPRYRDKKTTKKPLIQARNAYRASIAHLTTKQIQELANVPLHTAYRIKRKYRARESGPVQET